MNRQRAWWLVTVMAACTALPERGASQQRDSLGDTLKLYTLPPTVVSVTRGNPPLPKIPLAVQTVDRTDISSGRPTWGLDRALSAVPGVYASNRYNFSVDQRIAIRGFGARAAFAVRGIKVLLDGIPQTLPDGQGQLTNVDLAAADRIEVLRGASSALFGNASGGVISIWTDGPPPDHVAQDVRVEAGAFDPRLGRTWSKWLSSTRFRVGAGSGLASVSRLSYNGARDHSAADLRNLNTRFTLPLDSAWSFAVVADVGWDPRAENPGALTLDQLAADPDQADSANVATHAGKSVTQGQGGVMLRRRLGGGGEATLTAFGFTRGLKNPLSFAYVDLDRVDYGSRFALTVPLPLGTLPHRLTAGFDAQRQRDSRRNYGNNAGLADTSVRTLDQVERVMELGPFVQSAVDLTPQTTLTAGARYDRVSFSVTDRLVDSAKAKSNQIYLDDSGRRAMQQISWSVGVSENPWAALTLYASVGTSFEAPTTTELANRPDTAGGFNDALEPQTARSYEIGMRGLFLGLVSYSVALFQADVTDELVSYGIANSRRRFFRNAGGARHRGAEVGVRARLPAGLDLVAAYTFADYRYVSYRLVSVNTAVSPPDTAVHVLDGRAIPGIPDHWLHLTLAVGPGRARGEGRGEREGAWAEVEETYSGGYFVNDTLSLRADPWWKTDIRIGWDGFVGRTRFGPFVGFDNVFNRRYVGSVVINDAGGRYFEPAPGRNVCIGFSLGAGR